MLNSSQENARILSHLSVTAQDIFRQAQEAEKKHLSLRDSQIAMNAQINLMLQQQQQHELSMQSGFSSIDKNMSLYLPL